MTVLSLILYLLLLGFIAWLVGIAPVINATFKSFITWVLIVIGAVLVFVFLYGILGGSTTGLSIPIR